MTLQQLLHQPQPTTDETPDTAPDESHGGRLWADKADNTGGLRLAINRFVGKLATYIGGVHAATLQDARQASVSLARYCVRPAINRLQVPILHPGLQITYKRMIWASQLNRPNYDVPTWMERDDIDHQRHVDEGTRSQLWLAREWAEVLYHQLRAFERFIDEGERYKNAYATGICLVFKWKAGKPTIGPLKLKPL